MLKMLVVNHRITNLGVTSDSNVTSLKIFKFVTTTKPSYDENNFLSESNTEATLEIPKNFYSLLMHSNSRLVIKHAQCLPFI